MCKVYRSKGQEGFCGIGNTPKVSSVGPHFGEESVLVGSGGSGTILDVFSARTTISVIAGRGGK
jgi:putative pyruvate formate lyase activating enzyme